MPEVPLKVNAAELLASANKIDGHARAFISAHEAAHALAGGVSLGSGTATAALSGMLAAWEKRGTVFGAHFTRHSEGHRDAAGGYATTDEHGAQDISRWV
ncbi:MAG: ESX-1 secretion-associated protein [Mycobacterium sp.]|nr:ESX-1 secretion-associated protein [Mycobacterium sp.]